MKLKPARLRAYQATRKTIDKSIICHAPFSNINFEQNGNMTACCFNRIHVLGSYPQHTIAEAWAGEQAEILRQRVWNNDLGGGCKLCGELINSGNYEGSRAKHFDEYAHPAGGSISEKIKRMLGKPRGLLMPRVFEFEISNTCNLECTMCSGYFSSTIRKNREMLPAIPSSYDDGFVDQVAEFLPGLTDLKFLGGEPFLIKQYTDIWKKMVEVGSTARVHITTNGTLFTKRIQEYLSQLNAGIVISIDSINPDNYEKIRQGADMDGVLANIQEFAKITRKKNTYLSLAVCAMRQNWMDLPALVEYANENNFNIHFNVVWNPEHASLRFLSAYDLKDIVDFMEKHTPESAAFNQTQKNNVRHFVELIGTIRNWMNEKGGVTTEKEMKKISLGAESIADGLEDRLLKLYLKFYTSEGFIAMEHADFQVGVNSISGGDMLARVNQIREESGNEFTFFTAYMNMALRFSNLYFPERDSAVLRDKVDFVLEEIAKVEDKKEVINEILNSGLISQLDFINHSPKQEIYDTLAAKFYYEA